MTRAGLRHTRASRDGALGARPPSLAVAPHVASGSGAAAVSVALRLAELTQVTRVADALPEGALPSSVAHPAAIVAVVAAVADAPAALGARPVTAALRLPAALMLASLAHVALVARARSEAGASPVGPAGVRFATVLAVAAVVAAAAGAGLQGAVPRPVVAADLSVVLGQAASLAPGRRPGDGAVAKQDFGGVAVAVGSDAPASSAAPAVVATASRDAASSAIAGS